LIPGYGKSLKQLNCAIPMDSNGIPATIGELTVKKEMIDLLLTIVSAKNAKRVIVHHIQVPALQHGFCIKPVHQDQPAKKINSRCTPGLPKPSESWVGINLLEG